LKLYYRSRRLSTVTDETGRTLTFRYSGDGSAVSLPSFEKNRFTTATGYLESVTLPDGSELGYDYDHNRNLTRVRYPDETTREYHYENELYPHHLTGLTDRTGVRFATWSYDAEGRANSSEHAGGVERVTLVYPDAKAVANGEVVQTMIANSLGYESTYTWQRPTPSSDPQLLSSSGPGCASCPMTGVEYRYDEKGRLTSAIRPGLGNAVGLGQTNTSYDSQGRVEEVRHIDSAGQERLVDRREYDGNSLLPSKISQPSVNPGKERTVEFKRDARGLPTEIIERGFSPWTPVDTLKTSGAEDIVGEGYFKISRRTRLKYENLKLVSIDGPNDEQNDLTVLEWDAMNRLIEVHPPSSPVLSYGMHDELGRPTSIKLGSSRQYYIEYAKSGHVNRLSHRGMSVEFEHDREGRLQSLTDADGRKTEMEYDETGRTSRIIDDFGRVWESTFDSEGRQKSKTVLGHDGSLISLMSNAFDAEGRLSSRIDQKPWKPGSHVERRTDFEYDETGYLRSASDAGSGVRYTIDFDVLERSTRLTRPNGVSTLYLSDSNGNDAGVMDERGNLTEHIRNDFGQVVGIISRDTGAERLERDESGNVVARVREDSGRTTYVRDAAGRIVLRRDADGKTTRWTYNDLSGRLVQVENHASLERYAYDVDGMLTKHVRQIDGHEFVTHYEYDSRGRVVRKVLPDGQRLSYEYYRNGINAGSLREIRREGSWGSSDDLLISELDTETRDGFSGHVAVGEVRTRMEFDPSGQLRSMQVGEKLDFDYEYDESGRVSGIEENGEGQIYQYKNERLVSARTLTGFHEYTYDDSGNRTGSRIVDRDGAATAKIYEYPEPGNGNRLLKVVDRQGNELKQYVYGRGGTPISVGAFAFTYDSERRPITVSSGGKVVASYSYNASGERVKKVVHGPQGDLMTSYFLYEGRSLVAEIDEHGEPIAQYLYLDDHRPVIKLAGNEAFAIHTDHLGAARAMSDDRGDDVWRATYTPFGEIQVVQEDVVLPLRFPGQYGDAETGLNYNYYRYFDTESGRYLSSDPTGVQAGLNTYGYVGGNPLSSIDPLGLDAIVIAFPDYRPTLPADWPGGGSRPFEVGHGGILLFDEVTGLTRYYEFGRYTNLEGGDVAGAVRNYPVPDLIIGADGAPTQASLDSVFAEIAAASGDGTRIEGVHVDGADFESMNQYGMTRIEGNNDPERDPYGFIGNNCGHFTFDVLEAGGITGLPTIFNPMPSNFVDELVEEGYDPLTWNPDD